MLAGFFVHGRKGNPEIVLDGNPEFKRIDTVQSKPLARSKERRIVIDILRSDVFQLKGLYQDILNLRV